MGLKGFGKEGGGGGLTMEGENALEATDAIPLNRRGSASLSSPPLDVPEPRLFRRQSDRLGWLVETDDIHSVDMSDPTSPTVIGSNTSLSAVSNSNHFFVSKDMAAIIDLFGGLSIIDISDPANPSEDSTFGGIPDGAPDVAGMARHENSFYVCDPASSSGGHVLDVSDLTSVTDDSRFAQDAGDMGVRPLDDTLFACESTGDNDFVAYDVSSPATPSETSRIAVGDNALEEVVVKQNYAIVAEADELHYIDISDPASMSLVGSISLDRTGYRGGMSVIDEIVYHPTGAGDNSVELISFKDPANPKQLAEDSTGDTMEGVAIFDGVATVTAPDSSTVYYYY